MGEKKNTTCKMNCSHGMLGVHKKLVEDIEATHADRARWDPREFKSFERRLVFHLF